MFVSIELGAFLVRSSCNLFLFLHLCSVHLFPIELLSGYHVEGSKYIVVWGEGWRWETWAERLFEALQHVWAGMWGSGFQCCFSHVHIHAYTPFFYAGNLETSVLTSEIPVSFYSAMWDQPAVTLLNGSVWKVGYPVWEKRKAEEQSHPDGQAHVHHCATQLAQNVFVRKPLFIHALYKQ